MRYLMLYKGLICNITSGPKNGGRSQLIQMVKLLALRVMAHLRIRKLHLTYYGRFTKSLVKSKSDL